jgi:hypothetical protein
MTKKFRLLHQRFEIPADSIVYEYSGPTYGLVSDDIRWTGEEHIAVSLVEDKIPFFTVPLKSLEEIELVS